MTSTESKMFSLITSGLTSRDREERILAIRALGILSIPEHVDLLTDLLGSNDEVVVLETLDSLGAIQNPKALKYVLEFLHSENHSLAEKALDILGKFPMEKALDVVLRAAGPEQPSHIRNRILTCIRDVRDPRVSAFMVELVGQTKETALLTEAIRYFIRFPSHDRTTILRMLSSNSQWEIALMANVALSRLGDEGARAQWKRFLKSPAQPIRMFLLEALNLNPLPNDLAAYESFFQDSHPQIRGGALNGLGIFSADERVRVLRDWMARERDEWVRSELFRFVRNEKNPAFFAEFFGLLGSTSEAQKKIGISALSAMGEAILGRLFNEFPKMGQVVKEKIITVLGNIGGEKAIKAVFPFLDSPERWLRINAIDAVACMKAESAVPKLISMLEREEDIWVKATLLTGLSEFGNPSHETIFLSHLNAKDARVRANAIQGLWKVSSGNHRQILRPLLNDPNDRVRVNAAIAIWKTGNSDVLDDLIKMTCEGTKWVRSSAAFALGEIGDKEATPALLELLKDSEEVVYRNALEASAKIGDLRALIPLLREREQKRVSAEFFDHLIGKFAKNLHR